MIIIGKIKGTVLKIKIKMEVKSKGAYDRPINDGDISSNNRGLTRGELGF